MCIRDSYYIVKGILKDDYKTTKIYGLYYEKGILVKDHPISVSYTHLRAHETVLDLVCRLLLEKKKHIKYKIKYQSLILNIYM